MARRITERALTFDFNVGWDAQKYDDWKFFQKRFKKVCHLCTGVKAVDIVAYNATTSWLIEVKDYRMHRRTKTIDLADEVAKKVFDTLSGLAAARFQACDVGEKVMAQRLLSKSEIRVVLHLEQPRVHSKLFPRAINPADVKKKLKRQIKAIDPHPEVLEKATTNPTTHWRVS